MTSPITLTNALLCADCALIVVADDDFGLSIATARFKREKIADLVGNARGDGIEVGKIEHDGDNVALACHACGEVHPFIWHAVVTVS